MGSCKEYNTLKSELQELNMSYMKKKEKQDQVQLQDHLSVTSNKKVDSSKDPKLPATCAYTDNDFRARSSTCEDVGTIAKEHNQLLSVRPKKLRSRTLDMNELQGSLQHQHSPMNSPFAVRRKFGGHLFEKRSSLPCNFLPVTNSSRFASRRNSDFISSKQSGLSAEDIGRLSGSLSELEKAKPRPKPYEEKPFYLCPGNGSFRCNYWKSESVELEKRITEAQKRRVSRVEEEKVQGESRPLAEILPPVTLSSIYAQENNKAKRKEAEQEAKKKIRGGRKNGSNERLSVDISILTKDLSDCRYLRIPKNS